MRWIVAVGILATALAGPSYASAKDVRPNVIVIVTDDQPAATASKRTMPNTMRIAERGGARFENSIVSTPVCCPSRATFLTGQYGHNNGVLWNFPGYPDLRRPGNTLPVWMRKAGYRTVHVGKYLNGYGRGNFAPEAALPGWSEWRTVIEPVTYYGYELGVNGRRVEHGSRKRDYLTSVLNDHAVRMVKRHGDRRKPLFMVLNQFAPHSWGREGRVNRCRAPGVEPAWRDRKAFRDEPLPEPPSFDEPDVSDKPSFIQNREPLTAAEIKERTRWYRCSLASLRAVDRGVKRIWKALGRIGSRKNTMLAFTSDNGYYFGEHRVFRGKELPYRESVEVPLLIRLPESARPNRARGLRVDELVANVDLAPTILKLADADPCRTALDCRVLDGRSLVRLAGDRAKRWPSDRAVPIELDVDRPEATANVSCSVQGVWTAAGQVYLRHTSATTPDRECVPVDETEHYDLGADPFQLDNLFPATPGSTTSASQASLAARAETLSSCAGIPGRDTPPAGTANCE
ncbi:MAG: sulfatase family protein [Solirubrobacterales bacterium]